MHASEWGVKGCERIRTPAAWHKPSLANAQEKCAGYKGSITTRRWLTSLITCVQTLHLAVLYQPAFELAPLPISVAMDPNVLHDCAVEELNGVPDGQGYTIDQFLVRNCLVRKCSVGDLHNPSVLVLLGSAAQNKATCIAYIVLYSL